MSRKKRSHKRPPPIAGPVAPHKIDPNPPKASLPLLVTTAVLLVVWLGFLLVMAMAV